MRNTHWTLLLLVAFCIGGAARAQETRAPETRDKAAEMKKAMEAMARAATPGAEHKKLASMAGTFEAKVKMWMDPKTPPTESTGTAVNEMVLGGRWLQQRFTGTVMGQPFSGIGYTGYDNVRKLYVGTWMDSMSTSIMSSQSVGEEGKTMTYSAIGVDPVSGEAVTFEEKMTFLDNDRVLFEMRGPDMDGNMYKMMEITYTRKK